MKLEVQRKDIISLIFGLFVPYEKITKYEKLGYGKYYGGFNDKWEWNDNFFNNLSDSELLNTYKKLKKELN